MEVVVRLGVLLVPQQRRIRFPAPLCMRHARIERGAIGAERSPERPVRGGSGAVAVVGDRGDVLS